MCVPTLPARPKSVKSGSNRTGAPYQAQTTAKDRARIEAARGQRCAADEAQAAHTRAWSSLAARLYKRGPDLERLYSLALCSTHTGGRRQRPRTPGLVLTAAERERCRRQLAVAAACGTDFAAFRSYEAGDGGILERRLVCQLRCGTRTCEECEKRIRKRECWRVEGPWTQFYTVGCPPAGRSHQECWRRIQGARDKLWKRLERELARGNDRVIRVSPDSAERARADRAATHRHRVRRSPLDYAWTLEPHESGYPHLHFVTNTEYINWRWLRRVWGDLVGAEVRWIKCEWVYDADGTCRYLSKYISKTVFPPDLLALLYRKRMWATSRALPKIKLRMWLREGETKAAAAAAQTEAGRACRTPAGWRWTGGARGRYAAWERWWPLTSEWSAWLFQDVTGRRYDPERQHRRRGHRKRPEGRLSDALLASLPELWEQWIGR